MNQKKAWVQTFACDLMQNAWLHYKCCLQLLLLAPTVVAANIYSVFLLREVILLLPYGWGKRN